MWKEWGRWTVTYLKTIKKEIGVMMMLFVVGAVVGVWVARTYPSETESFMESLVQQFSALNHQSGFETTMYLFEHNATLMLIFLGLGVFWGIPTVFFVLSNGFVLGLVGHYAVQKTSLALLLAGILPHGLIELPCLFMAAGASLFIGVRAGQFFWRFLLWASGKLLARKDDAGNRQATFWLGLRNLRDALANGLRFGFTVITPLLFLSALIEAYLTPVVIEMTKMLLE